jgi:glutamyl-tRNA synthetase
MPDNSIRVRFAPSPTGHVHLGSARTALYDYLFAKQKNGKFILRIEDTDQNRYVEGAEQELIDGLHWLGIDWDEGPFKGGPYGPYRQSEKKDTYLKYAEELIEKGHAYYCFCSSQRIKSLREAMREQKKSSLYDGLCRRIPLEEAKNRVANGEQHVIRFKTKKDGETVVHDLLRGEIRFPNNTLDDYIIVKSDGWALYHLAATVDDHLMRISHVIRGSEWLPTSPLHHQIWKAFGWEEPKWVHLSVFLKPSGKGKMSKREAAELSGDGYSIFLKDLESLGYLPEAVINWIALMGWSYDDKTEFFLMGDLIDKFSLEKLNPSPAAINFSKLDHFNKLHIKHLSDDELAHRIQPFFIKEGIDAPFDKLRQIVPVIKERLITLDDSINWCKFLFVDEISTEPESLVLHEMSKADSFEIAEKLLLVLTQIEEWNIEIIENSVKKLMADASLTPKQLFSFLRNAISGQSVTPPLFECMLVMGKEKVVERMEKATNLLASL